MQVVHLQEISFTIAAGSASGTGTLSGFSDSSKMVPLFVSWQVADGQSPCLASNTEIDITIDSTTQITAQRWGNPNYQINVTAYVVQFGADTTVQSGTFAMTNAETSDVVSISAVTFANTFAVHYRRNEGEAAPNNDSDPNSRFTRCWFSATDELSFSRAHAAGAISGHWYTVSSSTLSVQHISDSRTHNTTSFDITISSVTPANTFIIASQQTAETLYNGEAVCDTFLYDATTVRKTAYYGGNDGTTMITELMVVSDTNITVERGTTTSSATSETESITSVDQSLSAVKTGTGHGGECNNNSYLNGNLSSRYWDLSFNSSTEIALDRTRSVSNTNISWEVVQFSGSSDSDSDISGAVDISGSLSATSTPPTFTGSIDGTVETTADISSRIHLDSATGQISASVVLSGSIVAASAVPVFSGSVDGQLDITAAITSVGLEIIIVSEGATFSPRIDVIGTPTILWTFDDDDTSDSATPTKNYGSAGTRQNRLRVTPWSAVDKINLGYDGSDGGGTYNPTSDYHPAQDVSSIENLFLVSASLTKFYALDTAITAMDFTGFTALDAVEFYDGSLVSVNLSGCTALRRVCFENCDLTALDVSDCAALEDIRGRANEFSTITFPPGGLAALWHLCIGSSDQLVSIPAMSLFPAMQQLWTWNGNLTGDIGISAVNTALNSVRINGNSYTRAQLDTAAAALVAYGPVTGYFDCRDNAETMSPEGCAAADTLEAQGWTVQYDSPPAAGAIVGSVDIAALTAALSWLQVQGFYQGVREFLLNNSMALLSNTVSCVIVNGDYVPDFSAHEFLSDVAAGARIATADVGGKSISDSRLYGGPADYYNLTENLIGYVLYIDTGVEATSRLIAYATFKPYAADAEDFTFEWDHLIEVAG